MSITRTVLLAIAGEIVENYSIWRFDPENVLSISLSLNHADDEDPDIILRINYYNKEFADTPDSSWWILDYKYYNVVLPFFRTSEGGMAMGDSIVMVLSEKDIETVKTLVAAMRM